MPLTRLRLWQLGAALVLVVYGFSGGCYAERLPPPLSSAELTRLRDPLPFAVTVVPWDSAGTRRHGGQSAIGYARATFTWLNAANAFKSVRLATGADSLTDLVASSMGLYCNTAAVPIFTIVSLGIIPTIFTERDCDGVVFHAAGAESPSDSVVVRHDNERPVVMGWLALPMGLLPGWTHGTAQANVRARNRVRLALVEHREALASLVSR